MQKFFLKLSSNKRHQWLLMAFLLILTVFLVLTATSMASHLRGHLLKLEQQQATLEIDMIQGFVTEGFLQRDYAQVAQFLLDWSQQYTHTNRLRAVLKNGYELIDYQRTIGASSKITIERTLTFANGNTMALLIERDLTDIENLIYEQSSQVFIIISFILIFTGWILWFSLNKIALEPMEEEINHRVKSLQIIESENIRMGAELEISKHLQKMILPSDEELNSIKELEICAYMQPATEIGGDYYDVLQRDNHIKIAIGDITGHGLESGILMLMLQTAVRTLLANEINDPKVFIQVLNQVLFKNIQRMEMDKWLTLSLLDYYNGDLTLIGQHEEILWVHNNREIERIDTFDLGFMIGLEEDIQHFVNSKKIHLNSGEGIILYTDGLTKARNAKKQQYGVDRLCYIVHKYWDESPEQIKSLIIDDLEQHIGDCPLSDDVTLLIIRKT